MRPSLFFMLFLLLGIHCAAQELRGPDDTPPGTLATFEVVPAQEASWYIVPPSPTIGGTYQVDTGLSQIYFASPVPGRYTVIAGMIADGQPQLLVKTFMNGHEDGRPFPIPVPPASSLEAWIVTQLPVIVKGILAEEVRLVAGCVDEIVAGIDEGSIQTAQNARTQLQIALTAALAKASPTAVTDWAPFLTELSRQLETELGEKINDLAEVKNTLQRVSSAMQSLALPNNVPVLMQHMDNPHHRGQGTRVFRNLRTR